MPFITPAQHAQIIGFWRQGAPYDCIAHIIGCSVFDVDMAIRIYMRSIRE